MISWRSIEFRLAAWYSLLLLAGLASLGAVLWFGVNYSMVAAVDELLATKVNNLVDIVNAEFRALSPEAGDEPSEGEFRGVIDRIDPGRQWVSLGGTKIHFTPQTLFESDLRRFGRNDLREGQYIEAEIERSDGEWFASEVSLEPGFDQELLEEIYEYSLAVPNGRLIRIRTEAGQQVLPIGRDASSHAAVPWQADAPDETSVTTVEVNDDVFRVLVQPVVLAGNRFHVQVASSLAPLVATRERLVSWLLWLIPAGVSLSFAGGYAISRAALRPVERVARVASRVDVGGLSERLTVTPTGDVVQTLEETFNQMLSRLEAAVTRLQQFTADASHELRSPVSVIRTTAELALRQDRSSKDLQSDMNEIHDEAQRLTQLIEDLLTLARADDGAEAPPPSRVDLGALVGEVCRQYRRLNNGRTLHVQAETPDAVVEGYEPSLRRLLVTLLDNAVQHTPAEASISVTLQSFDAHLMLSVSDTGEGIPADELGRVFDRFYRLDHARSRSEGGSGLGLSIAKWITESHGGIITASSEVGKGTTFQVRLPRRQTIHSRAGSS